MAYPGTQLHSAGVMKRRATLFIFAAAYAALFVAIALVTRPWDGGDGSIGFFLWTNLVSFPTGLVATWLLKMATDASIGTRWEHAMSLSPLWWVSLGAGCGILGYLQWAYVMSRAVHAVRHLMKAGRKRGI
jgi:hypothetical protein